MPYPAPRVVHNFRGAQQRPYDGPPAQGFSAGARTRPPHIGAGGTSLRLVGRMSSSSGARAGSAPPGTRLPAQSLWTA